MIDTTRIPKPAPPARGGLFDTLAVAFHDWRERRQTATEFAELAAAGELETVLGDAGIGRAQLPILLNASSAAAARRLKTMVRRLGLEIEAFPPALRREVEWTCLACTEHKACKRWLSFHTSRGYAAFCPNAATFKRQLRAVAVADAARTGRPA